MPSSIASRLQWTPSRARSSAGERSPHTREVAGSNPAAPTTSYGPRHLPGEASFHGVTRTDRERLRVLAMPATQLRLLRCPFRGIPLLAGLVGPRANLDANPVGIKGKERVIALHVVLFFRRVMT